MENKTLSPAEALRALAAGGKLRWDQWPKDAYIFLQSNGGVYWSYGETYAGSFHNLIEYTEPRPTRKVAPYLVQHESDKNPHIPDKHPEQTPEYFADEADLRSYYSGRLRVIRRITELEVTIED